MRMKNKVLLMGLLMTYLVLNAQAGSFIIIQPINSLNASQGFEVTLNTTTPLNYSSTFSINIIGASQIKAFTPSGSQFLSGNFAYTLQAPKNNFQQINAHLSLACGTSASYPIFNATFNSAPCDNIHVNNALALNGSFTYNNPALNASIYLTVAKLNRVVNVSAPNSISLKEINYTVNVKKPVPIGIINLSAGEWYNLSYADLHVHALFPRYNTQPILSPGQQVNFADVNAMVSAESWNTLFFDPNGILGLPNPFFNKCGFWQPTPNAVNSSLCNLIGAVHSNYTYCLGRTSNLSKNSVFNQSLLTSCQNGVALSQQQTKESQNFTIELVGALLLIEIVGYIMLKAVGKGRARWDLPIGREKVGRDIAQFDDERPKNKPPI